MSNAEFVSFAYPAIGNAGADEQFESARRRGYSAGYAEGVRDAETEFRERVAELEDAANTDVARANARSRAAVSIMMSAADSLDNRTAPVLAEAERALVNAATELAEAVLGQELRHAPTSARSALARALNHPEISTAVSVRMNPGDLALIGEDIRGASGIAFISDPSLSHGDALTQFPIGLLDARIATALERARQELREDTE